MALPNYAGSPTQAVYNSFAQGVRQSIRLITQRFIDGKLDADGFLNEMFSLLERSHGEAAYLGRQLSGDLSPFSELDRQFGQVIATNEREFLEAFTSDLRFGRYLNDEGNLLSEQVLARADSYAGRLCGTSNEVFVGMSTAENEFDWILGGENNCDECPDIAAGSPYTKATLPTMPRTNETPCLWNCNCELIRDDGVAAFMSDLD